MAWPYKSDASLRLPYQDNLSALIHVPSFMAAAGEAVFSEARIINALPEDVDEQPTGHRARHHCFLSRTSSYGAE